MTNDSLVSALGKARTGRQMDNTAKLTIIPCLLRNLKNAINILQSRTLSSQLVRPNKDRIEMEIRQKKNLQERDYILTRI